MMNHWRSVLLVIVGVMIVVIGAWAYRGIELLAGESAFAAKNYAVAANELKPYSGWHDRVAQAELGYMRAHGLGLPQDERLAFALMTKAANTGLAYAQDQLGTMYANGTGTAADSTQAAFWWRQAALQGNANGETDLANAYITGQGVGQDYGQAATWYQQAADQADARAEDDLGRLYQSGLGVPQDSGQAASYFQKSSFLGYVDAEVNLGLCYQSGSGVARDDAKAVALFREAAAVGNRAAQYYLGMAYLNGSGVAADPAHAQALFTRAAIQDFAPAQDVLGQVYARGTGGARDAVLAYMLFDLAAAQNDDTARTDLAVLAPAMTPEQIAGGQALASAWRANSPLPSTSFEDQAPQIAFGQAPAAVYAASHVWFSRPFTLGGRRFYTVFLATQGTACHGCATRISAVTFGLDDHSRIGAANFTALTASGDAPVNDAKAAPDSDARLAARVVALSADNIGVFVPFSVTGAAIYQASDDVFAYRLKDPGDVSSGQWVDAGRIATGFEHTAGFAASGDCDADSKAAGGAAAGGCVGWTGAPSLTPLAGSDWPEIDVKATGTVLDRRKATVAAPDLAYRFNGKIYAPAPDSLEERG